MITEKIITYIMKSSRTTKSLNNFSYKPSNNITYRLFTFSYTSLSQKGQIKSDSIFKFIYYKNPVIPRRRIYIYIYIYLLAHYQMIIKSRYFLAVNLFVL